MGFAIELYFDKESENKLIDLWRELHEDNISSYMYESGGHPHLALAVFNSQLEDIQRLMNLMIDFFNNRKQFKLLFSSLGIFATDEGVSFISPKVTIDLLRLHEEFYNKLSLAGYDKWFNEYYKPKWWIPHCTMTINTNVENQFRGLDLIRKKFKPLEVNVERVALIKFYPVKYIQELKLI